MTDASAGGYEHFEVEADVGVRAWGPRAEEAFARVAEGVFALIADPTAIDARERREVRAQGQSDETLVVNWINECLYVHDIEGFVVSHVEVDTLEPGLVHGVLLGEEFDRSRHHAGTVVKAATSHRVSVRRGTGRVEVEVVLDV